MGQVKEERKKGSLVKKEEVKWEGKKEVPLDYHKLILLVLMYLVQGIPLGLIHGAFPFFLQQRGGSYASIGVFTLSSYPYSLKILWSPFVDAFYIPSFGRRKTWIVPIQLTAGVLMVWIGGYLDHDLSTVDISISVLSTVAFFFVVLVATQDIAVDGWALTLLHAEHKPYASTCQTIGLNLGFFMSFTVFIALNGKEFCNKWIFSTPQEVGLIPLNAWVYYWGMFFIFFTLYLIMFREGDESSLEAHFNPKAVYYHMYQVLKLKHMQVLAFLLLVTKIGSAAVESIGALKLIEKGFQKEDLAVFVLIEFPFQILFAIWGGRASKGNSPLRIYWLAYIVRNIVSLAAVAVFMYISVDSISNSVYYGVLIITLIRSFSSTVMFVAQGAFFAKISNENYGGTYLTLLNILSNIGGTWPRLIVFWCVEALTYPGKCIVSEAVADVDSKLACLALDGIWYGGWDGFYTIAAICFILSTLLSPLVLRGIHLLQGAKPEDWQPKQ